MHDKNDFKHTGFILEEGPIPFGMGRDTAVPECVAIICLNTFEEASSITFQGINNLPTPFQ